MRVRLDPALLTAANPATVRLIALVVVCDQRGHALYAEPAAAASWFGMLSVPVVRSLGLVLREHRRRYARAASDSLEITVVVGPSDWPQARLAIDDALLLLVTPLEVLLENERSDWQFLRRMAPKVLRDRLDAAEGAGALRVRQGGGINELKKAVDELFRPRHHPSLDRQRRVRRLRTWVLFDRDADPTDATLPSAETEAVVTSCQGSDPTDPWPLDWERLDRRHIESYLPDVVLSDWARAHGSDRTRAGVSALAELRVQRPEAADSMHMKDGLLVAIRKADRRLLNQRQQHHDPVRRREAEADIPPDAWRRPFDEVPADLRADLICGFGNDLSALFVDAASAHDDAFITEYERSNGEGSAEALISRLLRRI